MIGSSHTIVDEESCKRNTNKIDYITLNLHYTVETQDRLHHSKFTLYSRNMMRQLKLIVVLIVYYCYNGDVSFLWEKWKL